MPSSPSIRRDDAAPAGPAAAGPSVVLTHHWLVRRRGGEKVLEALADLYPDAPIYTLVHDPGEFSDALNRRVHTSILQRLPGARRHYSKLLPLMPWAYRSIRLPPADVVLCADAALAKAMRPDPRSRVLCYCHSPMRYAWEPRSVAQYRASLPLPLRPLWGPIAALARRADLRAAQRVDQFIGNSRTVAERIRRAYGRDARVIYPFAEVPPEPYCGPRESFYLCVGQHVPYKRLDLAIDACRKLGRRLVVIGGGPEVNRFEAARRRDGQSDLHVTLLGWQPDEVVRHHYRRAAALLFPGEEDFGLVPVEAMGYGCPVVAFGVGGATETVLDGRTGVLFSEQTVASLADAMVRCEGLKFDPPKLHRHALSFSLARFRDEMQAAVIRVAAANG